MMGNGLCQWPKTRTPAKRNDTMLIVVMSMTAKVAERMLR